jgi:GNAT superfamily N-acetyltransferase
MSHWTFSAQVPADWAQRCDEAASLFHAEPWLRHLERALGCRTLFGADGAGGRAPVSVLAAGPFRVGYLTFPVGGLLAGAPQALDLDALTAALPVDLLRVAASADQPVAAGAHRCVELPETVVRDLPAWDAARWPKLVRDLKKAARSELRLEDAADASLAPSLHALYLGTLERHGGQMRYSREYFDSLLRLGLPNLRCLLAWRGAELAGFCVVALHGRSGYYLHGAVSATCRSLGVTDALLQRAIEWCRERGMAAFSLMTSPADQPGLVKYKEKWGGTTQPHRTFEATRRPVRAALFRQAARLHARIAPWLRR